MSTKQCTRVQIVFASMNDECIDITDTIQLLIMIYLYIYHGIFRMYNSNKAFDVKLNY